MEFRVLGPLEVRIGARRLDIGGRKSRALLGLLLLHANEVVSVDRLIHELWPREAPENAVKAVQVHVSRLRRVLESERQPSERPVIVTEGRGYTARVEAEELDLHRFRRLLDEGRRALADGEAAHASETLHDALGLWRGSPLADLGLDGEARGRIEAIEDLRLVGFEERIEADLACGRHAELVPELDLLVREHPLRERLRGQLMVALYRSGRQLDALEVYRETRRLLVDELGIEPGKELQRLEQAILRHDPELEPPTPVRPARASQAAGAGARARRRGALSLAAFLLVAAVGASSFVLLRDDGGARSARAQSPGAVAVAPNSVAVIDPRTNRVVHEIPVGEGPGPIAVGDGAVWVGNAGDRTVWRLDPKTRRVVARIGLGVEPTGLAVSKGALWVAAGFDHALVRIDTGDNVVRTRLTIAPRLGPLPPGYERGPSAVAVGAGAVWLAHGEEVSRIDPTTTRVVATIPAGGAWSGSIAFGEGAVWVPESAVKKTVRRRADAADGVSRIDPVANAVAATLPFSGTPRDVAVGEGSVWAVIPTDNSLSRIDPRSNRVARTIEGGADPWRIAVGEAAVWIANDNDGTVSRIDTYSNEVAATIGVGRVVEGIAAGQGSVWVSVR